MWSLGIWIQISHAEEYIQDYPGENSRGFEVDSGVIWLTIHVGKEKLDLVENPKDDSRNKALSRF